MNNMLSSIYYPFKNVEINDLIFSKIYCEYNKTDDTDDNWDKIVIDDNIIICDKTECLKKISHKVKKFKEIEQPILFTKYFKLTSSNMKLEINKDLILESSCGKFYILKNLSESSSNLSESSSNLSESSSNTQHVLNEILNYLYDKYNEFNKCPCSSGSGSDSVSASKDHFSSH
jgi:hypothetical protein